MARSGVSVGAWEIVLELTWLLRLYPWLQLQPDLQVVHQPGGSTDLGRAVVVGTRAVFSF